MSLKRKLLLFVSLLVLLIALPELLQQQPGLVGRYDKYVYYPFQNLRGIVFNVLPLSIGDLVYVAGGAILLVTIVKWVKYLLKFGLYKQQLAGSVLNTGNALLVVYLYFIAGWGANYYKEPLWKSWALHGRDMTVTPDTAYFRQTTNNLIAFDSYLVARINQYAPLYQPLPFAEVNERAQSYYRQYTDSRVKRYGQDIKPTLFGYFMERIAVEGYYNPFTGEGQVNKGLPSFILPFVISHEMAHQAGIAAEEDANLMAYALGTTVPDSSFRYSSYLNIWIYTNNRLYRRDSGMANRFEAALNKLTTAHLDTLEQLSEQYHNIMARYSSNFYDGYLKMQQQKQGIRSYGNVTTSAWQLEVKRIGERSGIIHIP